MNAARRLPTAFVPATAVLAALCWLAAALAPATSVHAAEGAAGRWLLEEPEFLPVREAFRLSVEQGSDGAILARWQMPDGYYLYRHRFDFSVRGIAGADTSVVLGEPEIPPGKAKVDDYFGEVEVYYHETQARIPIAAGAGPVEVGITYQGCADAGLCYPPETEWFAFTVAAADGIAAGTGGASTTMASEGTLPVTEEQSLASLLSGGNLLLALLAFFGSGIALAFTPCVLPMVPILSSIIVGDSSAQAAMRSRAFTLSLAYVLGMAVTYAAVGMLVGLFGASLNLQAALQSPPVLVVFALLFVLLSLSMFGFYELRLPYGLQNRLNDFGSRFGGGKHLSVLVMGALSALVVSPCVSAPLVGALIYLSTTGDALLGGGALLALGLGMGVPLLVIGASGSHLLPKAGPWMNAVKAVFGVGLLAVAVWLLERVLPAAATLALWAALAIGSGVYLGALDSAPRQGVRQLWKALGAFSFVYGVLLLIGAASGAQDPLRPLSEIGIASGGAPSGGAPTAGTAVAGVVDSAAPVKRQMTDWRPVADLAALEAELAAAEDAGRLALLDLYADWCISCKVMERSVFPQPEVDERLRRFHLLRADVTENDADDKALMNAFGLFGPPSLVFFAGGEELTRVRIQGEVDAEQLAAHLQAVLDHYSPSEDAAVGAVSRPRSSSGVGR